MKLSSLIPIGFLASAVALSATIDRDGNNQSDIWELLYSGEGLMPNGDADMDGVANALEAIAGTDPRDPADFLRLENDRSRLNWMAHRGKRYVVEQSSTLAPDSWETVATFDGPGATMEFVMTLEGSAAFYRVSVDDVDADGDGLNDWEELLIGFEPGRTHSMRLPQDDMTRSTAALSATNVVTVATHDTETVEDWPKPATVVLRRSGGLNAFTASVAISGSATNGVDFTTVPASVPFAIGQTYAVLEITPISDALVEGDESVIIALQQASAYTVGTVDAATVTIRDAAVGDQVASADEAARFLTQATFGPTPELIAEVQALGFEGWIEAQFEAPVGLLTPILDGISWGSGADQREGPYDHHKMMAWWEQAVRGEDHLRQRVAFALSEILVISDNSLEGIVWGMLDYYDMLLGNAFGNYRDILGDVTFHPCMGVYLSHRGNRPPDPVENRFPDENYAREVMQLFSIGLWMLNDDGTQILDGNGTPIPTYDNTDITNLARVFTGMSWGYGDPGVWWEFYWPDAPDGIEYNDYFLLPMNVWNGPYEGWDDEAEEVYTFYHHDQGTKTILGQLLPANDPENPEANYAENDINRALDIIFNHQNIGPFIGRQLIQRMVTSNPSPAYVARVAEAFNGAGPHNPGGVRGDMESVIKAILLDPEARDFPSTQNPHFGKQRVPYLKYVAMARAFNAEPPEDAYYEVYWIEDSIGMQPMSSPSVFNFYLPTYQPNGLIKDLGLVAPEFQITNAVTGIRLPNQIYNAVQYRLTWEEEIGLDFSDAEGLAGDADALIDYLDGLLTYGKLTAESREIIRFMLERPDTSGLSSLDRARLAAYIILSSPEFAILN